MSWAARGFNLDLMHQDCRISQTLEEALNDLRQAIALNRASHMVSIDEIEPNACFGSRRRFYRTMTLCGISLSRATGYCARGYQQYESVGLCQTRLSITRHNLELLALWRYRIGCGAAGSRYAAGGRILRTKPSMLARYMAGTCTEASGEAMSARIVSGCWSARAGIDYTGAWEAVVVSQSAVLPEGAI